MVLSVFLPYGVLSTGKGTKWAYQSNLTVLGLSAASFGMTFGSANYIWLGELWCKSHDIYAYLRVHRDEGEDDIDGDSEDDDDDDVDDDFLYADDDELSDMSDDMLNDSDEEPQSKG